MKPIVFWDIAYHYGGSRHVTVGLAAQLQRCGEAVVVLDAFGNCPDYMRALAENGVPTRVLYPHPEKRGVGGNGLGRFLGLAAEIPRFYRLIRMLRAALEELSPAMILLSDNSALMAAKRAVGGSVPMVYYSLGEYKRLPWYGTHYWKQLDLMLGLSQRCLDCALALVPSIPRTAIVFNGLDVEATVRTSRQPIAPLPGMERALKLVFPATLLQFKAQDIAIRAMAQLRDRGRDVQLWLAGAQIAQDPLGYAQELRRLVHELKVEDRVSFLGWHENVLAVMVQSDAVVLTSRTEGVPCSLMQAMALEKPVVATRVGGIPELVRDGIDGFLIDVNHVEQTVAAIEKLADPERRREMGRAGRVRIEQNFTIAHQATAFLTHVRPLYRQVDGMRGAAGTAARSGV